MADKSRQGRPHYAYSRRDCELHCTECWAESDVSRDLLGVVFEGERLRETEVCGRARFNGEGLDLGHNNGGAKKCLVQEFNSKVEAGQCSLIFMVVQLYTLLPSHLLPDDNHDVISSHHNHKDDIHHASALNPLPEVPMNESSSSLITADDTVFRYLCPVRKIGSVISRGGDIVKQLRTDTKAKIHIDDALLGCDKCVATIHSSSEEINHFDEIDDLVSLAQDELFRVHQRVIAKDAREDEDEEHVTAKLLVPSDQIGYVNAKGG
ncbi:hypothetical protein JHK86_012587 [Glycine max]|nr:hypothetical protein JHK86_012587 [Glycine max]